MFTCTKSNVNIENFNFLEDAPALWHRTRQVRFGMQETWITVSRTFSELWPCRLTSLKEARYHSKCTFNLIIIVYFTVLLVYHILCLLIQFSLICRLWLYKFSTCQFFFEVNFLFRRIHLKQLEYTSVHVHSCFAIFASQICTAEVFTFTFPNQTQCT